MTAAAWHAGELALQARAGVDERLAEVGARFLRDHMPEQHRSFFAQLPFLLAGTLAAGGAPQVTLLPGAPGFAHSPEPRSLRVALPEALRDRADFAPPAPIGLLGIQAHTRRRNRLNGWITQRDAAGITVAVGQSFGNCPKYIQPREAVHAPQDAGAPNVEALAALDAAAVALLRQADTFFIATAHPDAARSSAPAAGVDVSHRGGPPGFVQVDGARLRVPDYVGNSYFNTLGNLQLDPRCALLFVDFASGEQLQLAARARLQWDGPEVAALPGALRLLELEVVSAVRTRGGLPVRWRPAPQAQL